MSNEYVIIKNVELNWAKLDKPVNPFGTLQYEVQIATTDKDKAKEFEVAGLKVKEVDGKYVANLKRKALNADGTEKSKVAVFDGGLEELDASKIGNGSQGNVKIYRYSYEFNGRKGISNSLTAIQVTKLVEYTGGSSMTDGFEVTEAESPKAGF